MIEDINKRVTEALGKCYHEFEQVYRWGIKSDEWCFNKEIACEHPVTIPKGHCFKASQYCIKCRKSIVQLGKNKNYAENIADAWKLVEWMKEKYYFVINTTQGGNYDAGFQKKYEHKHTQMIFNQKSESMAICLAFLTVTENNETIHTNK